MTEGPSDTEEPMTEGPSDTEEPSMTGEPMTETPMTEAPSDYYYSDTEEPSVTDEPKTEEPSMTDEPKTEAPSMTDEPMTEAPSETEEPSMTGEPGDCPESVCAGDMNMIAIAIIDDKGCPACECRDPPTTFVFGSSGTVCDPWQMVDSEQQCQEATAALGSTYSKTLDSNYWSAQHGCILSLNSQQVMYNENMQGHPFEDVVPLCTTDEYDPEHCE